MSIKSSWWCCLLGCALVVVGCRSTTRDGSEIASEFATSDDPDSYVQKAPWETMTFFDKPELQEGTGPVDDGNVPEFTATDSGLRYRVLRKSGGQKPTANDTVTVKYRGWLNNGKIFDSSYERGEPATFGLRKVVDGWTEGMQLVGEGGMIELWVPSSLGYGEAGSAGSIPPHSHLHFIVELLSVN